MLFKNIDETVYVTFVRCPIPIFTRINFDLTILDLFWNCYYIQWWVVITVDKIFFLLKLQPFCYHHHRRFSITIRRIETKILLYIKHHIKFLIISSGISEVVWGKENKRDCQVRCLLNQEKCRGGGIRKRYFLLVHCINHTWGNGWTYNQKYKVQCRRDTLYLHHHIFFEWDEKLSIPNLLLTFYSTKYTVKASILFTFLHRPNQTTPSVKHDLRWQTSHSAPVLLCYKKLFVQHTVPNYFICPPLKSVARNIWSVNRTIEAPSNNKSKLKRAIGANLGQLIRESYFSFTTHKSLMKWDEWGVF
jgi:hypothetical protein